MPDVVDLNQFHSTISSQNSKYLQIFSEFEIELKTIQYKLREARSSIKTLLLNNRIQGQDREGEVSKKTFMHAIGTLT